MNDEVTELERRAEARGANEMRTKFIWIIILGILGVVFLMNVNKPTDYSQPSGETYCDSTGC